MTRTIDLSVQPQSYQAYLIRIWRSSPDVLWNASAQHTQSGETVFLPASRACSASCTIKRWSETRPTGMATNESNRRDELTP
ncbi:MAG: hypothetical protein HZY76_03475 [Anaerolineae bacterium]|nr:MAG: hypothetical protein HZY76_03475 [Anaerolineae bacterium]